MASPRARMKPAGLMLRAMSPERVLFAFVIVLALKFGDRSPLGSTMLATSLVADLQLVAAAVAWGWLGSGGADMSGAPMATVVSLALGALVANVISVVLLVVEVANLRR
jgi:Ca2+/H+ antiporter, TMEM165/GDT1 family